jgi:hypothetical protein
MLHKDSLRSESACIIRSHLLFFFLQLPPSVLLLHQHLSLMLPLCVDIVQRCIQVIQDMKSDVLLKILAGSWFDAWLLAIRLMRALFQKCCCIALLVRCWPAC